MLFQVVSTCFNVCYVASFCSRVFWLVKLFRLLLVELVFICLTLLKSVTADGNLEKNV